MTAGRGNLHVVSVLVRRAVPTFALAIVLVQPPGAQGPTLGPPLGHDKLDRPQVLVEKTGTPIPEQARHAFSQIDLGQFSSGVLLDLGSVLSTEDILQHGGQVTISDPGMPAGVFLDALGDLALSKTGSLSSVPAPSTWTERVERWRQVEELTPISIAVVPYDRVLPDAYQDGRLIFDGEYLHEGSGTPYAERRLYVATTIAAPALYGPVAHCVIPADLLIGAAPSDIQNIQIQFDGQAPMSVGLDQSFDVSGLVAGPDGSVRYTLSLEAATARMPFQPVWAAGLVPYASLPAHYSVNVDPVEASIPYAGVKGKMNVRLYSKRAIVQPLHQPIVIVDGIDVLNNRTFDDIWADFGETLQKFLELDHDLIVIDYQNGRDYIQRNGLALRSVLSKIPEWVEEGHQQDRVALVAGSMGTQVARYALKTAENSGEDHHVGLFVSVDGPYRGANIPIGIQGWVEFFASTKPTVQLLLDGLNSPAASQLLRRNRWHDGVVTHIYAPHPDYTSYYAEADALGLPQRCRNVAVASGSGIGERADWRSVVQYLRAKLVFLTLGVDTTVNSDHNGVVFSGYIKKSLYNSTSMKWTINSGATFIDLAPGGQRETAEQIQSQWNANLFLGLFVPMSSQQKSHCFIPTSSALGIETSDLNYAPASDAAIRQKSPFDGIYHGVPNTHHVSATSGNVEYIVNEVDSFFGVREHLLIGNLVLESGGGSGGGVLGNDPLTAQAVVGSFQPYIASVVARDELLTVNTQTRKAMVQQRDGAGWKTLWSSGSGPWIGGWYINPGDKYFLADVSGSVAAELVCVSAAVPAWAMVQTFNGTNWVHEWDNGGGGMLGPWRLRTTDQYAFGRNGFAKRTLLAVYPYQGHSSARLLLHGLGTWQAKWSNGDGDMIGGFPIQLGNQYSFANVVGTPNDELFTVNTWTNPIGWWVVQGYVPGTQQWSWITSGYASNGIGTQWVRGAGDRYEFADSDGDGRDELHCFSSVLSPWAAVFDFTPGTNGDWTLKWQNGGSGLIGNYVLTESYRAFTGDHPRAVDVFAWGKLAGLSGEEMLGIAPHYFGQAFEQSYESSPPGWLQEWTDFASGAIGAWALYQ